MSMLRAPVRLGIVVVFALASSPASASVIWPRRRPWLPWLSWGRSSRSSSSCRGRSRRPARPARLQLLANCRAPPSSNCCSTTSGPSSSRTRASCSDSTYHWQPLVNGYSDLIPPDFEQVALLMTQFPDPASFAMLREPRRPLRRRPPERLRRRAPRACSRASRRTRNTCDASPTNRGRPARLWRGQVQCQDRRLYLRSYNLRLAEPTGACQLVLSKIVGKCELVPALSVCVRVPSALSRRAFAGRDTRRRRTSRTA